MASSSLLSVERSSAPAALLGDGDGARLVGDVRWLPAAFGDDSGVSAAFLPAIPPETMAAAAAAAALLPL